MEIRRAQTMGEQDEEQDQAQGEHTE